MALGRGAARNHKGGRGKKREPDEDESLQRVEKSMARCIDYLEEEIDILIGTDGARMSGNSSKVIQIAQALDRLRKSLALKRPDNSGRDEFALDLDDPEQEGDGILQDP